MHNNHSVLIVEDDAAIRDVFAELLRAEGHTVSLAANGEEALKLLIGAPYPCLILLDLLMPVLDGWEVGARLAEVPALAAIPIIVVSAQPESSGRLPPRGAAAWLTKPVALDVLLTTIENQCGAVGAPGPTSGTPPTGAK